MTERTFLTTANTEADVRKIADWYGWQVEEDNSGQLAQEAAAIYHWDYDSDNLGAVVLFTGVQAADVS